MLLGKTAHCRDRANVEAEVTAPGARQPGDVWRKQIIATADLGGGLNLTALIRNEFSRK